MRDENSTDYVVFEDLFKRHYTLLTARAFELCRNWQMAEDAVQEFFADLWLKKSWQSINTSFAAYAVKGVQYKIISFLRKSARQDRIDDAAGALEIKYGSEENEHRIQRELQLITALNELPAQRKEAFLLAHYHNKSYAEIGEQMGLSINTVKTHLRLALSQLRRMMTIFIALLNFF